MWWLYWYLFCACIHFVYFLAAMNAPPRMGILECAMGAMVWPLVLLVKILQMVGILTITKIEFKSRDEE